MNAEYSNKVLDNIIYEATSLASRLNAKHQHATWSDYEYFKKKLHLYELFGYEKQIADILQI